MLSSKILSSKTAIFRQFCKMSSKPTLAVCQFTATHDKEANLDVVKRLVKNSAKQNAKMVFLPEASDFISRNQNEFKSLAEPLNGPLMSSYQNLAKTHNLWLSVGGFHEKNDETTIFNSHVIIDDNGVIKGIYRKIHLFDVTIPEKNVDLKESDLNTGGSQIPLPVETPLGLLGQLICYDLRFPEQSTILRKLGADILSYPSAFTSKTGTAHWETLLRARAIENQCYVVAAAQYGKHNEKRISHGQAMVVDPWGQIIAECPKYTPGTESNESIALATIDLEQLNKIRLEMPVLSHRRNDIYSLNLLGNRKEIDNDRSYNFADKLIPGTTVFYVSKYCYAFTNIRCVVPGHVLISTLRQAKRLADLTEEEIADLFQTTVKVTRVMELEHNAQSSTVCVQDGQFAGQTIPHVHAHVLPRKQGDFANNDDIYSHLAKHDSTDNVNPLRSREEQEGEAAMLRRHFYN